MEINQGLDDSLFTFIIPQGAEVVTLADLKPEELTVEEVANLSILTPASLPADASYVETTGMRGAVVQRYNRTDGGSFTWRKARLMRFQSGATRDLPLPCAALKGLCSPTKTIPKPCSPGQRATQLSGSAAA
ncbi:MAG: hypothetical protein M5U34_48590 [Chloroflexi bacterium]|nr:hypothetical protein [Chloroflexota bacterium]